MRLPPPFSWLWEGWKKFSHAFGRVMSAIILTVLWVIGFSAYGIIIKIMKLFQKEEVRTSYWEELPKTSEDHLLRQF